MLGGILLVVCAASGTLAVRTLYQDCDPGPTPDRCPPGYCCVRDEFDPTQVYCESIGQSGEGCSVQPSVNDCPCGAGLTCRPNIQTAVFTSMYGTCRTP